VNKQAEIPFTADYRKILDSLSISVFLLDAEFAIVYLNESAETLIQTSLNRAWGLSLTQFVREGKDFPENSTILAICNKSQDENLHLWLREVEISIPGAMQKKQVDCRIFPLKFDTTPGMVLEILPHDSERTKQVGDDEIRLNQAVIRGLAHEIRNPLGGMRGAAQLLSSELMEIMDDGQQIRELTQYTDIIIREADRLSDLVGQMQASGPMDEKRPVNIHSILEQVRNLLVSDGLSGTIISTDYDPSLPNIMGDPGQLTQAFINILKNAIEAADSAIEGGLVIIKSRIDHQVLPANDRQHQVVRVDIIDNGAGIDKALLDHVFEPMVSGKHGGTGLGLSITSEIFRSHGGLITVHSEPGNTVFSTYLKALE
jgi:two-component system nitrogen regulation sensor histidine kinase GlnL